jgi:hypothetical protein
MQLMPIKPTDQAKLDDLFATHKGTYAGRREDYFAPLYLTRKFKVEVSEIAHQVAFGGNDYGIDAYFIDKDAHNLYLYQFKWSEDHGQFKGSMERLAKDGLGRVFGSPHQDAEQNDVLVYLKKALKEHRDVIDRVYLHFVFKGASTRPRRARAWRAAARTSRTSCTSSPSSSVDARSSSRSISSPTSRATRARRRRSPTRSTSARRDRRPTSGRRCTSGSCP